ncbi:hypothetical protein BGZ83_011631 [Gryganskiella cystojenkinii]|nr:hypothetical protein BGZ83_011631 [Gryganskiella cystojenkinii]
MPAPSTTTTIETSMIYDLDAGVVGMDDETLPIMSPGRISHALCKIGFDCIDYFTATTDDALDAAMEKQKRPRPSHRSNVSSLDPYIRSTGLRDDELNQDWQTGLAAAVGGKRTAALERKRARSRTMSVDQLSSYGSTRDPWFETLDRLSRWDEIVRK